MSEYDDHETSCALCSVGLSFDALCECSEPVCCRCHRIEHVEVAGRWAIGDRIDQKIEDALRGWGR